MVSHIAVRGCWAPLLLTQWTFLPQTQRVGIKRNIHFPAGLQQRDIKLEKHKKIFKNKYCPWYVHFQLLHELNRSCNLNGSNKDNVDFFLFKGYIYVTDLFCISKRHHWNSNTCALHFLHFLQFIYFRQNENMFILYMWMNNSCWLTADIKMILNVLYAAAFVKSHLVYRSVLHSAWFWIFEWFWREGVKSVSMAERWIGG